MFLRIIAYRLKGEIVCLWWVLTFPFQEKNSGKISLNSFQDKIMFFFLYVLGYVFSDVKSMKIWPSWLGLHNTPTTSLQRGKITPTNVLFITWNNLMVVSSISLSSLPGPRSFKVVLPDRVQSIGQIEWNCVLMLNWIVWNRIVLHLNYILLKWMVWKRTVNKYCTYTKLNCLK